MINVERAYGAWVAAGELERSPLVCRDRPTSVSLLVIKLH